jgi:hypothetical protein
VTRKGSHQHQALLIRCNIQLHAGPSPPAALTANVPRHSLKLVRVPSSSTRTSAVPVIGSLPQATSPPSAVAYPAGVSEKLQSSFTCEAPQQSPIALLGNRPWQYRLRGHKYISARCCNACSWAMDKGQHSTPKHVTVCWRCGGRLLRLLCQYRALPHCCCQLYITICSNILAMSTELF